MGKDLPSGLKGRSVSFSKGNGIGGRRTIPSGDDEATPSPQMGVNGSLHFDRVGVTERERARATVGVDGKGSLREGGTEGQLPIVPTRSGGCTRARRRFAPSQGKRGPNGHARRRRVGTPKPGRDQGRETRATREIARPTTGTRTNQPHNSKTRRSRMRRVPRGMIRSVAKKQACRNIVRMRMTWTAIGCGCAPGRYTVQTHACRPGRPSCAG